MADKAQKRMMTAEDLLNLPDAEAITQDVDLSAFGLGVVRIRQFSVADQVRIRQESRQADGEIGQRMLNVLTLQAGLVEPQLSQEQAETLLQKRFGVVQHILNAIHDLSGLTALLEMSEAASANAERNFRKR